MRNIVFIGNILHKFYINESIYKNSYLILGFLTFLTDILEASSFYHAKMNSKISFQIKSWIKLTEENFKNHDYKRANDNFCLLNYKRMRMRKFHLHLKVNYYISKCGFQQHQNIFYGFQNGQLVEIVNCQF